MVEKRNKTWVSSRLEQNGKTHSIETSLPSRHECPMNVGVIALQQRQAGRDGVGLFNFPFSVSIRMSSRAAGVRRNWIHLQHYVAPRLLIFRFDWLFLLFPSSSEGSILFRGSPFIFLFEFPARPPPRCACFHSRVGGCINSSFPLPVRMGCAGMDGKPLDRYLRQLDKIRSRPCDARARIGEQRVRAATHVTVTAPLIVIRSSIDK